MCGFHVFILNAPAMSFWTTRHHIFDPTAAWGALDGHPTFVKCPKHAIKCQLPPTPFFAQIMCFISLDLFRFWREGYFFYRDVLALPCVILTAGILTLMLKGWRWVVPVVELNFMRNEETFFIVGWLRHNSEFESINLTCWSTLFSTTRRTKNVVIF